MRDKYVIKIGLILFLCLTGLNIKKVFSADNAELQLLVAVPNPVQANTIVNIQAIVANTGTEDWLAGEYLYETDILNDERKFITKTKQYSGTQSVKPGEKVPLVMEFNIPPDYVGSYFYRFSLIHKGQKIIYSDFYSFYVSALPLSAVAPPSPSGLVGNALFSYRNDSTNNWKNDRGELNLMLNGRFQYQTVAMNMYTTHTKEKSFDLYSLLFGLYANRFDLILGDVAPVFSPLSLYSTSLRGGYFKTKYDRANGSLIATQMVTPKEGTQTTNGIYARSLVGMSGSIKPAEALTVSLSNVTSSDDKNSILTPGPGLKPVNNNVSSILMIFQPVRILKINGEYATSLYSSNADDSSTKVSDSAYRVAVSAESEKVGSEISYTFVNPDFVSLGSPTIIRDRASIDTYIRYRPLKFTTINASYSKYDDNTKKSATKTILSQDLTGAGVTFNYGKLRALTIGYSLNKSVATPETVSNNRTETYNTGIFYDFLSWLGIYTSVQRSDFRDLTKISNDMQTDVTNFSFRLTPVEKLSISLGDVITKSKDQVDNSTNEGNSYSIAGNITLLPEKLNTSISGTYLTRKSNKQTSPSDSLINSVNVEATYFIVKDFGITVGTGVEIYKNNLDITQDYNQTKANIRTNIRF